MDDVSMHLRSIRRAEITLTDFRRGMNAQINDRLRMIQKHERAIFALETDGQLDIAGIKNLDPSPELKKLLTDPTSGLV